MSRNGALVVPARGRGGQCSSLGGSGCTALAFHSIEVQRGIQRCIEAVTDWQVGIRKAFSWRPVCIIAASSGGSIRKAFTSQGACPTLSV